MRSKYICGLCAISGCFLLQACNNSISYKGLYNNPEGYYEIEDETPSGSNEPEENELGDDNSLESGDISNDADENNTNENAETIPNHANEPSSNEIAETGHDEAIPEIAQTGFTKAVPASYRQPANEQGNVVRIDYESQDFVRDNATITKTAYVYLPFGYDENDTTKKYNIIYLMHGWGGHAGEYFEYTTTKNVFDNLIQNGDIQPAIIVSATFYNDNSDRGFGGSVEAFRAFHLDFEKYLMPTIEGRFHTYAASTSDEGLKASRDHRAFGGFSLGSVTTWLEFCYDYDYIRYFLPMSGSCWYYGTYGDFQIEKNVDFIEQLVKENSLDNKGYFIYHAVGTKDSVKSQSIDMAEEMLTRDIFTPDHYVFYQKDGGYHDFEAVQEYLYNALPLFFKSMGTDDADSELSEGNMPLIQTPDFTIASTVNDVIQTPAFRDFGYLLFPVHRSVSPGMTLEAVSSSSVYVGYNYINKYKTVKILNALKSRAEAGQTIFYDIYSDAEKSDDPDKADTGLFFFKGERNKPFAIVNAGGGFYYVGAMHDSFPHALELSKKGYNAFALIYRPGAQTASEDLARAIAFIHDHADELGVSTKDYSLWGGSAGARMAAWLGSYGTESFGQKAYPRPSAVIMQYTGLSEVTGTEPPTYNCVGTSDGIASYQTMQNRINRIKANGTDAEIDIFSGLPHGFGLGEGTVAEGWIEHAVSFWERQMK